ncbi:hypothetical protein CKK33_16525 [Mucilaginibacter sp. MD40]|uniref:glycosyltransferase family 2 protein n=1 Tax=Mucilaginibacter sp. MD40 TaxID=2029590 RepID=UPI000BACA080|nr:glycosyltransferase family 2 protein [Mucilaginibacter sp. MD40]PAW95014.1 hypothetical protein CKK33_16525 [Mucilaginibacter sp. MD40]
MKLNNTPIPVSVIIPCFNCKTTVKKTLDSVKDQTLQPTEVILVDDCSSDGTFDFLTEILPEYPTAKLMAMPQNGGPGIARNAGWGIATQPWIAFLDADDTWHPDKLKIQWQFIQKDTSITMWGHQTALFDHNKTYEIKNNITIEEVELKQMLISNKFPTRSVILKKDIPFRFRDKSVTEDYLLWLEIISSGYMAKKINCVLAFSLRPDFSPGGYSGQLWKHEKRELKAFKILYEEQKISYSKLLVYSVFSVAKYFRRVLISATMSKK